MLFDPAIWGPHYWFFLHTISHSYPETPNAVTKRKYYDFIQNLPLFIPIPEMGDKFSQLLDKYPVSPYLDNRESFIRWVIFIHNKMNAMLGKEELTFPEAYEAYLSEYKIKPIYLAEKLHIKKHYLYFIMILLCLYVVYLYYT
jgi:hypothetical protein